MDTHLYMDAFLQPVHEKDEFRAFCSMVDRTPSFRKPAISISQTGDTVPTTTWLMPWRKASISSSVPRMSYPKESPSCREAIPVL